MSGLWTDNLLLLLLVLAVLVTLTRSLRGLLRPKRRWPDADWAAEEQAANIAWGQHRQEAYDAALAIALANGDLVEALTERTRTVGEAFRGVKVDTDSVAQAQLIELAERMKLRRDSGVTHMRSDEDLQRSADTAMTLAGEHVGITTPENIKDATLEAVAPMCQLGAELALDPWSRRV